MPVVPALRKILLTDHLLQFRIMIVEHRIDAGDPDQDAIGGSVFNLVLQGVV